MSTKPNNNPKNKAALLQFQRRQLEFANRSKLEAKRHKTQSNLELWEDKIPKIYKKAKPAELPESLRTKLSQTPFIAPYNKYIVIQANESTNATFVAFSIVHALLQRGDVTPSQVRKSKLIDGYNNINGMFQSRNWKDYFFSPNSKVLIIEGASKSLSLLMSKGEEQFWKELEIFTQSKDVLVIITYLKDQKESEQGVFVPTLTIDTKLNTELVKKSAFVQVNNEEENEIEIKQK